MKVLDKILELLNLTHNQKRVTGNIAWLVGGHAFRMVLGLIVLGMVARYLGPDEFGILNYAIGLAVIFTSIATLGMEGIVIREMVRMPESVNTILGTSFVLRVAGSVLAVGAVSAAAVVAGADPTTHPYIFLVSLAFLPQSFEVIDLWFQKNIQSKYTILARSAAVLMGAGFKIALVLWKASLTWFCIAYVMDFAFIAVALGWIYFSRGGRMQLWDFSLPVARHILRDSWPLIVSGVLIITYMRIEQILVMNVLGSRSAGIYYASAKIMEIWAIIPSFILTSVYPIQVEKRKHDPQAYRRQLQLIFDVMSGLGFVMAVAVFLLAPAIIWIVYGPEYRAAVPVLMVHAWSALIIFSGSVRGQYFLLENINIYHTWCAAVGIVLNVVLGLLFMRWIGTPGAAAAAVLSYWVSAYGTSYLFPRLRECAGLQSRAFLLPLRVPEFLRSLKGSR